MGGVARARAFAKKLNDAPLAIVDKRRSAHNISEVMNLIGDVKDKVAVLVDDMIDTAGAPLLPLKQFSVPGSVACTWPAAGITMSCMHGTPLPVHREGHNLLPRVPVRIHALPSSAAVPGAGPGSGRSQLHASCL